MIAAQAGLFCADPVHLLRQLMETRQLLEEIRDRSVEAMEAMETTGEAKEEDIDDAQSDGTTKSKGCVVS